MSDHITRHRFDDRVVVVTGGAFGIGQGISRGFAMEGARVAILDQDGAGGTATAASLAAETESEVVALACDIADDEVVDRAIAEIVEHVGPPTVLVNNAGIFAFGAIEDVTVEVWQRSLAVNVMGPALVTRRVVPHMRRAGGGAIVNIGSVSSFIAQPEFMPYSATKAAIPALTRCLALDLAKDGIRVNCVCPGAVWSATVQKMAAEQAMSREELAGLPNLGAEQIQQRIADVDEIASAVLFMASSESSFITGASLMVDGGWTAC